MRRKHICRSIIALSNNGAVALICAVLAGCVTPARLPALSEVRASEPQVLHSSGGELSHKRSQLILAALAKQAGTSENLLRHVAIEDAVSDSPLVIGNRVTLLRDGPATYRAMYEAISSARHHINLEVFIFEYDEVGEQLMGLLLRRQQQGVQVNVIYDAAGSAHTPPEFFAPLKKAGGRVVQFNPLNPAKVRAAWRVDQRDHRKLLIIDGHTAFTGGINFSSVYSSGSLSRPKQPRTPNQVPYRDTHIKVEGPVVKEFQKLFLASWNKQHGDRLPQARYMPSIEPKGTHVVRAVGSTADDGISVVHTTMLSAIAQAERSIYLTNAYFVPDRELIEQLKTAAQRGVDVRLVLPSQSDFWAPLYAGRAHYDELLHAGVKLYERRNALLHAKTAVVDQVWSTVGSANLDQRSFRNNDEINAVILGEQFGVQMEQMFKADLAQSTEVTLDSWKRRGLDSRIKETAARLWQRWL
jgi:cardiolipin synthase